MAIIYKGDNMSQQLDEGKYNAKLQNMLGELNDLIEDISHYERVMPKSKERILEYMELEAIGDRLFKRHHWKTKKLKKSLLKKGRHQVNRAASKIKSFYNETDKLNKPTMSIAQVAKHHGVSIGQIRSQVAKGIEEEMSEHTSDRAIAKEIALDHLKDNPNHYDKVAETTTSGSVATVAGGLGDGDPNASVYSNKKRNRKTRVIRR